MWRKSFGGSIHIFLNKRDSTLDVKKSWSPRIICNFRDHFRDRKRKEGVDSWRKAAFHNSQTLPAATANLECDVKRLSAQPVGR